MSDSHSTIPAPTGKPAKPQKPYPDFPLFAHAAGVWAKKIKGKVRYFGKWDDWQAALAKYEQQKDDLEAGRTPTPAEGTPATPAGLKMDKPDKPRPDFPLFAHASGQWAKKIRGRMHYFGKWDDPEAALKSYQEQQDDLHAGRTPRPDPEALTIKQLCNAFIHQKQALVDSGELTALTLGDYKTACEEVGASFGPSRLVADLRPEDFAVLRKRMAKKWGPHRLGKTIQFVRCIFKYGYDAELIDRPIRFGPGFQRPSKKVLRLHRAEAGTKLFTADEVRRMIDAAGQPLKTMLLLGINCAFGNSDCGNLPIAAVDLDNAVTDYPRPKTGLERRCPLWPETVAAIREVLDRRPEAKSEQDAGLVFLTRCRVSWHTGRTDGPLTHEVKKLLRRLRINGRRGLGFYTLRHTFRTVADEAKDQPAADFIMGHEVPHMSAVYRETISDARLRAVADHVRGWLFPSTAIVKSVVE
jgi:integrase